jgi:hypothetical protein
VSKVQQDQKDQQEQKVHKDQQVMMVKLVQMLFGILQVRGQMGLTMMQEM